MIDTEASFDFLLFRTHSHSWGMLTQEESRKQKPQDSCCTLASPPGYLANVLTLDTANSQSQIL